MKITKSFALVSFKLLQESSFVLRKELLSLYKKFGLSASKQKINFNSENFMSNYIKAVKQITHKNRSG